MERAFPSQAPYDFGQCACGGIYESFCEPLPVERIGITLTNVPKGKCPVCGAFVYKARVLDRIERTYSGREPAAEPHPLDIQAGAPG